MKNEMGHSCKAPFELFNVCYLKKRISTKGFGRLSEICKLNKLEKINMMPNRMEKSFLREGIESYCLQLEGFNFLYFYFHVLKWDQNHNYRINVTIFC